MHPSSFDWAGRLDTLTIDSQLLRDNPLGDAATRPVYVYLPPGYDDEPDRAYPSVYVIQGYGGLVSSWLNDAPFRRNLPQAADAAFASGDAAPAIVVYVDAWTAYGGSQFVDSVGTGRYHSYLCDEVVAWVDARYRTLDAPAHRAIAGKSSGGFGAMITPMLRPDLFGALATHAGDALYEHSYLPQFALAVRALRAYDGDIFAWWRRFRDEVVPQNMMGADEDDMRLALVLGCTACFSPASDGTPELPFDPTTGAVDSDRWQRWLDWDPVRMAASYAEELRGLRAVWIDAGTKDEFFLDLGAQAFRAELDRIGVADDRIRFESHDMTHSVPVGQYVRALSWLTHRISPEPR